MRGSMRQVCFVAIVIHACVGVEELAGVRCCVSLARFVFNSFELDPQLNVDLFIFIQFSKE